MGLWDLGLILVGLCDLGLLLGGLCDLGLILVGLYGLAWILVGLWRRGEAWISAGLCCPGMITVELCGGSANFSELVQGM